MNKLKAWVTPLFLATLMTAANIVYWSVFENGKPTLIIWINIITLILCGFGFTHGLKFGFTRNKYR